MNGGLEIVINMLNSSADVVMGKSLPSNRVTHCAYRMLVDLGVIDVLTEMLRVRDAAAKLLAGNSFDPELIQGPEPLGHEIAEYVFCVLAVAKANAVSIAQNLVRILRKRHWLQALGVCRSKLGCNRAIPPLVELLGSQSNENCCITFRGAENAAEALINFFEDPLQHEIISQVADHLSFRSTENRLGRIRTDNRRVDSTKRMNIGREAYSSK
ncbi:uncharacterized protein LOC120189626 [Hibiscus syriacus]|uniref:uncharacterized protein LOC120189626 n=1 Tax=Hibiscus syriacus TaxID=106335 RepID=UPI001923A9D1|nr:uncharacterized protein LOC120189626 [Hibiscus syriacus]